MDHDRRYAIKEVARYRRSGYVRHSRRSHCRCRIRHRPLLPLSHQLVYIDVSVRTSPFVKQLLCLLALTKSLDLAHKRSMDTAILERFGFAVLCYAGVPGHEVTLL